MNAQAKRIVKIVVDVLFWIFFAVSVAFTVIAFASRSSTENNPRFGNKVYYCIASESMENSTYEDGGFKKGDLIISTVLTRDEKFTLQEGQVITFKSSDPDIFDQLNTHRIVNVETIDNVVTYTTRGDNNNKDDDYKVYADQIEAVWTGKRVAGLGGVISFLQKPYGFWPLIVAPLTGLLAYEIVVLIKAVNAEKNKDTRRITKADEELIKQKAIEEFLKKQEAENASSKTSDK